MSRDDAWTGTVVKKRRMLLDGSNLYRRLVVRTDEGHFEKVRVEQALWKELNVGDRLVKEAGQDPRHA